MYYLSSSIWFLIIVIAFIVLFIKISNLKKKQEAILKIISKSNKNIKIETEKSRRYVLTKEESVSDFQKEETMSILEKDKKENHEYNIGSKIIPAIGALSIILGIGFFLKYAFDNNLIDETGRVVLGFVSGIIFIVLGIKLRFKYQKYSGLLMGIGFVILYLAGKFGLIYELYSDSFTFVFLVLITAFAVLISEKLNSKVIALIALVGGFLVPILSASGSPNELILFNYILILLLGIFYLVWKRNWVWLSAGAALGTIILYSLSFEKYYSNKEFIVYWAYLIVFFVIFTVVPFLYSYVKKEKISLKYLNLSLPIIAGGIFISLSYWMFQRMSLGEWGYNINSTSGRVNIISSFSNFYFIIGVIPAIFYLILAKFSLERLRETGDKVSVYFFVFLASFSIALIPALQFSGNWVTFAWLAEAIILVLLYLKTKNKIFFNISLPILFMGTFRLLFINSDLKIKSYSEELSTWVYDVIPIINSRTFIYFIGILTFFFIAYIAIKYLKEKKIGKILGIIGNLLFLYWIYLELSTALDAKYISWSFSSLLLSIFYMMYAIILMTIGIIKSYGGFRVLSIIIFIFIIAKTYFFDIWELSELTRILAFIILGLVTLGVGYYYTKNSEKIKNFLIK